MSAPLRLPPELQSVPTRPLEVNNFQQKWGTYFAVYEHKYEEPKGDFTTKGAKQQVRPKLALQDVL